jgi:SAM-dependent methyltransferase
MQTAAAHYETHLGPIYAWMLGDTDAALARAAVELNDLRLPTVVNGVALDLGAGLGFHAVALADRGFRVTAIDSSRLMLDQLSSRRAASPITAIHADFLEFRPLVTGQADVILCMGDTLTHAPTFAAVESLLAAVSDTLAPQGLFVTTFRDYATKTLEGDARFILVRADEQRMLTCFLEYGDQRVVVHDLLYQNENGRWRLSASSYPKLRLAPDWVASKLTRQGLRVSGDTRGGMVRITATRT